MLLKRTDWRVVNLDMLTYAGNLENLSGLEEGELYHFVKGDVADLSVVDKLFQEERPSVVINFAAESHVDRSIIDPSPFIKTNVIGAQVLLEAARQHQVERFIQMSTDEVYGDTEGREPSSEETILMPSSPYAASKAAADLMCLAYRRTHRLPVLIVRSANNYGAYQFPEKLIPLTINNALKGKDLPIYGDGLQQRDWLYVEDCCRAILNVVEQGTIGSIYNIGTEKQRTNLEVVRAICQIVAKEANLDLARILGQMRYVQDRPGHDRCYALNTQKIRRQLGWSPEVSFEVGLKQTVCWYLEHQDWLKRVISGEYQTYYDDVYLRTWKKSSK